MAMVVGSSLAVFLQLEKTISYYSERIRNQNHKKQSVHRKLCTLSIFLSEIVVGLNLFACVSTFNNSKANFNSFCTFVNAGFHFGIC